MSNNNLPDSYRVLNWLVQRRSGGLLVITLLCSLLIFIGALGHGFVNDDHALIENNPGLKDPDYIATAFLQSHAYDLAELNYNKAAVDYYRPFTRLLFAYAYQVFGLETNYWHALNLMLFAIVAALIFINSELLSKNRAITIITTALFIFHPIHTEAAAWINCIVELLHAIFFLAATACYFASDQTTDKQQARTLWIGSLMLTIAALLSKEAAMCMPILIGAYRFINTDKALVERIKATIVSMLPFTILLIIYLAWRYWIYGGSLRMAHSRIPEMQVLLTIPLLIINYIKMIFVPVNLNVIYDITPIKSISDIKFWLPFMLLISAAIFIWTNWPRQLIFAAAWFLITLMLTLNIGIFRPEYPIQDRYAFLPSFGCCLLLGTVLFHMLKVNSGIVWREWLLSTAIIAIMIFLAVMTVRQNRYWHSDLTLWQRAVAVNPDNAFARCSLGWSLFNGNDKEVAGREFTASFKLSNGQSACGCSGLASYYAERGDSQQAITFFEQAVALGAGDTNPFIYTDLARLYFKVGEKDKARTLIKQLLEVNPEFEEAKKLMQEIQLKRN